MVAILSALQTASMPPIYCLRAPQLDTAVTVAGFGWVERAAYSDLKLTTDVLADRIGR